MRDLLQQSRALVETLIGWPANWRTIALTGHAGEGCLLSLMYILY